MLSATDSLAIRVPGEDNDVVPGWGSFSYTYGPIIAVIGLAVLVLILRWGFSRGQSVVTPPARPGPPSDYGLLVPVAEPLTPQDAERMRLALAEAGITCNVARTTEGLRVMVWPTDLDRARGVLGTRPGG